MVGKRLIAMVDILGFSDLVERVPLAELSRRVEVLFDGFSDLRMFWAGSGESGTARTGHAHFSDTILLWTRPLDGCSELRALSEAGSLLCGLTQMMLRGFIDGLPLRAGVAFGETYIDEGAKVFLGPPIVAAYHLERSQEWIGGALDEGCFRSGPIADGVRLSLSDLVVKYPVPMKSTSSLSAAWALNWVSHPYLFTDSENGDRLRASLKAALAAAEAGPAKAKFGNTAPFVRQQIEYGQQRRGLR